MPASEVTIQLIDGASPAGETLIDGFTTLLRDAIDDGASVGFLSASTEDVLRAYWTGVLAECHAGRRLALVASCLGDIAGCVQLVFATQENAPHRAEVQRLLVRRSYRRAGIGRRLMLEIERQALARGRTLLLLNTRTGDPPEMFYQTLGYKVVGRVPDFAMNPDGSMNDTTILYRRLEPDVFLRSHHQNAAVVWEYMFRRAGFNSPAVL
jgi:acetyltransferase